MKIRPDRLILLVILLFAAASCGENSFFARRKLIPEKNLVPLLTDLYITDGLLQYPGVRDRFNNKDTISSYLDVIKKHGYSKEQLDKTLQYYFVNDPKKLQKIYDQVLARLTEIQSRADEVKSPDYSGNLWDLKNSVNVPEEGPVNPGYFNIQIKDTGTYTLTFSGICYKNDQSLNPRVTVFFWKADSSGKQIKKMWSRADYIKDDLSHEFTVTGRLSDTSFHHIGGYLLDCDPQTVKWEKHASLTNIILKKGPAE